MTIKATFNRPGSFWTAERDEELERLWTQGLTCSQIASRMKAKSRNAVVGRARRLDLPSRAPAGNGSRIRHIAKINRKARPKPERVNHPWRSAPKPLTPAAQVIKKIHKDGLPLPEPKEIDVARVSVFEVEPYHCRWVASSTETDKHGNPRVFCGEKKEPGLPYCKPHAARAYAPPQARRPDLRVVAGKEMVAA